jgi:protein tyrosine/serine phosphatase
MRRVEASLVLVAFLLLTSISWADDASEPTGVPNFHTVDEHLYRGAQPSPDGFKSLSKLGIKVIIDLREGREHAVLEQKLVESAGMKYVNVPMRGLNAPTDEQMATVFALLGDSSGWPTFVHCKRGADRTGTVVACYRISHDHWQNEKALKEARLYGMSRIEVAMQRYILEFKSGVVQSQPLTLAPAAAGH